MLVIFKIGLEIQFRFQVSRSMLKNEKQSDYAIFSNQHWFKLRKTQQNNIYQAGHFILVD